MDIGKRQVIAEMISSTVRVLELLGFDYEVGNAKRERAKGNASPRVIIVVRRNSPFLRVYNSAKGHTWANKMDGTPIATVGSVEGLYDYLYNKRPRVHPLARRRGK